MIPRLDEAALDLCVTDAVPTPAPSLSWQDRAEVRALLLAIFLVSVCGLIYELLIATLSSYLIGSSVTQFSLCIGTFIGAMGLGSYLSQFVTNNLLRVFLLVEMALGAAGGFSAWGVDAAYACAPTSYYVVLFGALILIGTFIGLELPLLTRLLQRYGALRTSLAHALSLDYGGALAASVIFPLFLLPALGVTRTAFAVGLLNVAVAACTAWVFRSRLRRPLALLAICAGLTAALLAGLVSTERVSSWLEARMYRDKIIFAEQTRFQRIVMTRWHDDVRLYLDGSLQFSSADEYRYHESLVLPAMALTQNAADVLVIGGGDGLALREVLKNPGVQHVTLVDIDPAMTRLARTYPPIVALNHHSLEDPRVQVVNADAFTFLAHSDGERYGVIIADLPDPEHEGVAKLYSREFYELVGHSLGRGGMFVTQATSPYFARDAFWCVAHTVRAAGLQTTPYHAYVPSFGDWGFVLASRDARPNLGAAQITSPTRFLSHDVLTPMTVFDGDSAETNVLPSTLDRPRILTYYTKGARRWE